MEIALRLQRSSIVRGLRTSTLSWHSERRGYVCVPPGHFFYKSQVEKERPFATVEEASKYAKGIRAEGGKLVTSTGMSDLNAALNDLRDKERKFRDDATAKKGSPVANVQEAVQFAGQPNYDAYKDKAKDVAALFTAETGITVGPTALNPTLD